MKTTGAKNLWNKLTGYFFGKRITNVYFISGMCNSCSVFDDILLPDGFQKIYIEWLIPQENESLTDYSRRMAKIIDKKKPFVLIGYSFGAMIVQEIHKFLKPQKCVIISSMKSEKEIPKLFKFAKRIRVVRYVPKTVFESSKFIINIFSGLLFNIPKEKILELLVCNDPVYIKWAVEQITQWQPVPDCPHIYHIHGTKDEIFPYTQVHPDYSIQNGNHLMVIERASEVSKCLEKILTQNTTGY